MKTTKASIKKVARGNGQTQAKSAVRGGVVKCTASKTERDGTTCTVEGTCNVGSARACEDELKHSLS
jgi:hypothetical protein